MSTRAWWIVAAIAVVAALAPVPPAYVERWYSRGFYPPLQRLLTPAGNLVPFAVFDVLIVAAIVASALVVYRAVRRGGWARGLVSAALRLARVAAVVYLVFLVTWGMNYRRVPLLRKVDFDRSRVTTGSADALAHRAIAEMNRLYLGAHARPTPSPDLVRAFEAARHALQPSSRPIVPGRPKDTLLGGYFHLAAVSGMTDPFLLETLVSPDLLEVERPFVVSHEWAHLAGYADESEANFLAWLACMRGDDQARYSGWLSILGYLPVTRGTLAALDGGPRADLFAIRYRYRQTSRIVRAAAEQGYDTYLKANRVDAGVVSYDLVVQLILGTSYDARGNPISH